MSDAEKSAAPAEAPSGGGSNKLVVIVSLVNLLATLGIVGVLVVANQKEKAQPSVEDIVNGEKKNKEHGEAKGGHGDAKAEHGGGGGGHGGGEAHGGGGHGDAKAEHGEGTGGGDSGKIIPLEPFTVNLASSGGSSPRYVRINISMELEQGAAEKEFETKLPKTRDVVINLLSSKKPSDLAAAEGREQLKEEMKRSVNGFMSQSKVKGIYFTNFAISN